MNGRAVAKALQMVAEGVGDIAPKIVDEVPGAARKALDDIAGAVDDWGWKGGKPGEITGTRYFSGGPSPTDKARNQLVRATVSGKLPQLDGVRFDPIGPLSRNMDDRTVYELMDSFLALEDANVPREWTGKIVKAFGGFLPKNEMHGVDRLFGDSPHKLVGSYRNGIARLVSDNMKNMTNQQRETFLALLPEWEGSIDDLANAARSL